ncbi:MAG: hypothetical protein M1541_05250 [Acidobacteria bacterium]|nr:hypothetical protein [Acidobacteriota bacterium]
MNTYRAGLLAIGRVRRAGGYTKPVILGGLRNAALAAVGLGLLGIAALRWLRKETCGVLEKRLQRRALSRRKKEALRLTSLLGDALFFEVGGLGALLFLTWLGVYVAL